MDGLSNALNIWFVVALRYLAVIVVATLIIRRNSVTSISHALRRTPRYLWSYITSGSGAESNDVDFSLSNKRSKRRGKTTQQQSKKHKMKKKHVFTSVHGQILEQTAEEEEEKSDKDNTLQHSPMLSSTGWKSTTLAVDELTGFTVIRSRAAAKAAQKRQHNGDTQSQDDTNMERAFSMTRTSTRTDSEVSELGTIFTAPSTTVTEQTLVEEISEQDSESYNLPDTKLPESNISHLLINMNDKALPANHSRGVSLDSENTEKLETRQRSRSVGSQPLFLWPP